MSHVTPAQATDRLWTVDFVLTLLSGHFLFAGFTSLFTIVPLYVIDRGGQEWQIGVVVGSFGVVSLLVRPFAGRWIYLFGPKRIAAAGLIIFAIASILYIPASGVWWLVPVRMLQGIGLAMAPVASSTIVANLAPATRRAEAMAYLGNALGIASMYAPVVGFLLLSPYGFPASFIFSASNALLGALLALRISSARTRIRVSEASTGSVPLISRSALFPTAVFLTYTITVAPVSTFLPLLAENRQLGNPGLYFTVFSFTTIVALLLSGPIADRLGRPTVIIPGLLTASASMFLLAIASNQPVFLAAGFLTGVGFGLLQPGIQSLTIDRVAPRERSSALATLQSAWDIGGSGGAFILGPIAGAISVAATFGIVGAGALAGAVGFVVGNARAPAILPREQDAPPTQRGHP